MKKIIISSLLFITIPAFAEKNNVESLSGMLYAADSTEVGPSTGLNIQVPGTSVPSRPVYNLNYPSLMCPDYPKCPNINGIWPTSIPGSERTCLEDKSTCSVSTYNNLVAKYCPEVCTSTQISYGPPSIKQAVCPANYASVAQFGTTEEYEHEDAITKKPANQIEYYDLQTARYNCYHDSERKGWHDNSCRAYSSRKWQDGTYTSDIPVGLYVYVTGFDCNCKTACGTSSEASTTDYLCEHNTAGAACKFTYYYKEVLCTRPAGYYPVPGKYTLGNVMCARVLPTWQDQPQ